MRQRRPTSYKHNIITSVSENEGVKFSKLSLALSDKPVKPAGGFRCGFCVT